MVQTEMTAPGCRRAHDTGRWWSRLSPRDGRCGPPVAQLRDNARAGSVPRQRHQDGDPSNRRDRNLDWERDLRSRHGRRSGGGDSSRYPIGHLHAAIEGRIEERIGLSSLGLASPDVVPEWINPGRGDIRILTEVIVRVEDATGEQHLPSPQPGADEEGVPGKLSEKAPVWRHVSELAESRAIFDCLVPLRSRRLARAPPAACRTAF